MRSSKLFQLSKYEPSADSEERPALRGRTPSGDSLLGLRTFELLEHIDTLEARQVLQKLAEGAPHARLTREAKAALERLNARPAKK